MHGLRKKIICLLLSAIIMSSPAYATGMPVVDFSAIATAVANGLQTVQQWQQQLQKWQSEYNRYVESIRGISTGNWKVILRELSNMVDTARGSSAVQWWASENTKDQMTAISGTFADLLKIYSPIELLIGSDGRPGKVETLWNEMMANYENIDSGNKDGWETAHDINNATLSFSNGIFDMINLLGNSYNSIVGGEEDLLNDILGSLRLDKTLYRNELETQRGQIIENLPSSWGVSNYSGFSKAIDSTQKTLALVRQNLANTNKETNPTAYDQYQTSINTMENKIQTLKEAWEAYDNITAMIEDLDTQIDNDRKNAFMKKKESQQQDAVKMKDESVSAEKRRSAEDADEKISAMDQTLPALSPSEERISPNPDKKSVQYVSVGGSNLPVMVRL